MKDFKRIISHLDKFKPYGNEITDNGTVFIGKAPWVAPKAWLFIIYPPINENEIILLEKQMQLTIPMSFRQFLLFSNGLSIFHSNLSIFGLRTSYNRSLNAIRQPFNIVTPNTYERLQDANDNQLFIGFYCWDGSLLYIDNETEKVYRCSKDSTVPLNQWNNFAEMLESEIIRLISIHNDEGIPLDKSFPTTP
jgi:hypothetical protein